MRILFNCIFLFTVLTASSQKYPQNYFIYPIDIPVSLSANFGELRTNHYHMGIDIRTQQRENLRILAAADGYISRIFISHTGYGNMLMIKHPNGMETLYGHLNDFNPQLMKYLEAKQYKDKSWAQDFRPPQGLLPVKKGDFIAYSGNTGGSAGPHLHFEIRDAITNNGLNPMLFGLGITDNIRPQVYGLYYYDRRYSTYQLAANKIPLSGSIGTISGGTVKVGTPLVSFGYHGEDKISASSFKFGIYKATLFVDGEEEITSTLNDIPFNQQRYMNAGIDYKKKLQGGPYVEHLSILPGNKLDIFSGPSDGVIDLSDGQPRKIKMMLEDTKGNATTISFTIQYDATLSKEFTFPKNMATVYPGRPGRLNTPSGEFIYSPNAFYDYFNFDMKEIVSSGISNVIKLDNAYIPIHDEYSIGIKTKDISAKDKTVMQLISGSYKALDKGLWDGDVMIGHFNRLGNVSLVKDETNPVISTGSVKEGMTVRNGTILTMSASDNLGTIKNFNVYADGQWLLFKRRGNTFTYKVDDYLPKGKSKLVVSVEDVAGNKTVREININKS